MSKEAEPNAKMRFRVIELGAKATVSSQASQLTLDPRVHPQPPPQLDVLRLQRRHPSHQPRHQRGKLVVRRLRRLGRGHNPDDRRSKT
ncbi:MAG: hypothetical protein ACRDRX_15345 [Pseudonocardiaceae bacterium]